MEKSIPSPALSIEQSSSIEEKILPGSTGVVVVGLSLGALIRRIGLWKAFRSKIARSRYTLRLWLVREIYLWKALNAKYEQIPDSTKEKRILAFVRRYPFLRRIIERLEKRLNKRLIANPYQPSLTTSNKARVRRVRKKGLSLGDLKLANQIQQVAESFNNQKTF